jgi:hypothetical protein
MFERGKGERGIVTPLKRPNFSAELTPFIPLSNRCLFLHRVIFCLKGGDKKEGG